MAAASESEPPDEVQRVWDRPARRAHAQAPSLSRDQIVQAAIEAADEEGAEAISMRRVASRLGSGTMTLYWYVSNKQDLLDLMVDQVLGEIELPTLPLGDWRADLKMIANNTRAVLHRHRWMAPLVSFRKPLGPNWLRHREASLAALDDVGFDAATMASVVNTLNVYVLGFVRDELANDGAEGQGAGGQGAGGQGAGGQGAGGHGHGPEGQVPADLDIDEGLYPTFARQLREVGEVGHDDRDFEFGLDSLLDGIGSRVPRSPRRRFLPHRP
jgi:AcrR family transcriptional regulator